MSSPRCIQGRFKQGHRSAIKSGFFSDSITLEMVEGENSCQED
jgi:hypothetical protein